MKPTISDFRHISDLCSSHGLHVYTYSPGDGVTRYRFSRDANSSYFACHALTTVCGRGTATAYLRGFLDGKHN